MKAMILAAGRSTRLGTLAEHTPKPMLPLGGRPVLEWTLERLQASGVNEVVINLHHAPEVIPAHFGDGSAWGLKIAYIVEPEILGTAGGVRNARDLLGGGPFLVVYGDNVMTWDPAPLLTAHRHHDQVATMAIAELADPSKSGIVQFTPDGTIVSFVEKPGYRPELGRWVNAGVYVLDQSIFDHIPSEGASDFGFDVFPAVLAAGGRLRAYRLDQPPLPIDSPELYEHSRQMWSLRAPPPPGRRS